MFDDNKTDFQRYMDELAEAKERRKLAKLQQKYPTMPNFDGMSLPEELNARYDWDELNQLKQKYSVQQIPIQQPRTTATTSQYGDATAKVLDDYLKDYKTPEWPNYFGPLAPMIDFGRNYATMWWKNLDTSDKFFHCKANYEAASRSPNGIVVANILDLLKEMKDIEYNKYPISDSISDYRANLRGQRGFLAGKTLEEACPTHYKDYE